MTRPCGGHTSTAAIAARPAAFIEAGVVLGFPAYYGPGRPELTLHLVLWNAEELLTDAEPRDLGIQLWHRYADLRVTYVCAPAAREAFTPRLRTAEQFHADDPW